MSFFSVRNDMEPSPLSVMSFITIGVPIFAHDCSDGVVVFVSSVTMPEPGNGSPSLSLTVVPDVLGVARSSS